MSDFFASFQIRRINEAINRLERARLNARERQELQREANRIKALLAREPA